MCCVVHRDAHRSKDHVMPEVSNTEGCRRGQEHSVRIQRYREESEQTYFDRHVVCAFCWQIFALANSARTHGEDIGATCSGGIQHIVHTTDVNGWNDLSQNHCERRAPWIFFPKNKIVSDAIYAILARRPCANRCTNRANTGRQAMDGMAGRAARRSSK